MVKSFLSLRSLSHGNMKTTKLIPYSGVDEIGGVKILVSTDETSIFLDFGKPMSRWKKYYDFPYLMPKSISQLIAFNIIPGEDDNLRGLYTVKHDVENYGIEKEPETCIEAVFISHMHLDHFGHVPLLNRKIKVYAGRVTYLLCQAYKLHSQKISVENDLDHLDTKHENFKVFRYGDKIKVGDLEVTPIPVDHSIPGAYAFLIDTGEHRIVYTGDIRWHGPANFLTTNFVKKASEFEPDLMLCDATRFDKADLNTEEDVRRRMLTVARECRGVLVTSLSPVDIDRVNTVCKIADEAGRTVVMDMSMASKIARLHGLGIRNYPNLSRIFVLKPSKLYRRWQKLFMKHLTGEEITARNGLEEAEEKLGKLFAGAIEIDEIAEKPHEFALATTPYSLKELSELSHRIGYSTSGGVYIASISEPFEEEMEIKFERVKNWIESLGLAYYHIHSSGHAHPFDIAKMISEIKPKTVSPVHSMHSTVFQKFINRYANVKLLKCGVEHCIGK